MLHSLLVSIIYCYISRERWKKALFPASVNIWESSSINWGLLSVRDMYKGTEKFILTSIVLVEADAPLNL